MGMTFQFATAGRIVFGAKSSRALPEKAKEFGRRIFLITGKNPQRFQWLKEALKAAGLNVQIFSMVHEPDIPSVQQAVLLARQFRPDLVIAMGGGSVLDTGKIVSAMITNRKDLMAYLEVIGEGKPIREKPVPCLAVPTTAGTGTEVTKNAVVASPEHRVKVSMRHPWMIPDLAIIDPELTCSMPPEITASTGLDALTQLIEPYVTHQHNPLTDAVCREGLRHAARSLRSAFKNGEDAEAREDMAIASLFGGLALANAKLGAVHGIAGPMGGMFQIPHGILCARLLPPVMAANIRSLHQKKSESGLLQRFHELGQLLNEDGHANADDALTWIQAVCDDMQVPPLSRFDVDPGLFPELIQKSMRSSSMQGNPVSLNQKELMQIIEKAVYER